MMSAPIINFTMGNPMDFNIDTNLIPWETFGLLMLR